MVNPDTNEVLPSEAGTAGSIDQMITGRGSKPFPKSRLQEYARQMFGGDLGAAEDSLNQSGYVVDDGS